jgi:hypothetical protein
VTMVYARLKSYQRPYEQPGSAAIKASIVRGGDSR